MIYRSKVKKLLLAASVVVFILILYRNVNFVTEFHRYHKNPLQLQPETRVQAFQNDEYPLTIAKDAYTIENKHICAGVKKILFVVLVHSSTLNFQRRNSIRETWGNISMFMSYNMRIVFLLGKPADRSLQTTLQRESDFNRDIVQGAFVDTYHNLTHKAVLGLRWVAENCRLAKYVVKVDDDIFVNTFQLIDNLMKHFSNITRTLICNVKKIGSDRIHREGKWKVDSKEFVDETHWQMIHCSGYLVILTGDIIPELYEAAKRTPFLWIDDVYVTGLLADKIGNISYLGLSHLGLQNMRQLVAGTETTYSMYKRWSRILAHPEHRPDLLNNNNMLEHQYTLPFISSFTYYMYIL